MIATQLKQVQDITIECSGCKKSFVWTAGEQEFYQSKGLSNTPRRCRVCRKQRNQYSDEALLPPLNGHWYSGTVIRANGNRGFGFISAHGVALAKDVFFHMSQPGAEELKQGDHVRFELAMAPKGPTAVNVKVVKVVQEAH